MFMKHLVLNLGEKCDGKKCYVVVDRNIVISGQTGCGRSTYAKFLVSQDDMVEFTDDVTTLDNLKPDTKLVILDDVYKVEDQLALQEKIEELNKKDIYVGLVVISSRHINKIDIREAYVLRIKTGVENSRSIIFEDNNNMTQLIFEI
ncbi:MAG: AAA family ATPase [Lachnospiraceae bacterium]|nr:MAG: AAA family ATPase [Lachnospiraceae bacterium]